MNPLHAMVLVLLCVVVMMDVKMPPPIKSLGKIPVTIFLLFLVFYLFTQSPLLGVVGLIAAYQSMQSNLVKYIQPHLPADRDFNPQYQFQETLEEEMIQRIVPLVHTQSPPHLNFKSQDTTHSAEQL